MPTDLPINHKTTIMKMNAAIENAQEDSRRRHLGGSVIGKRCERELWYIFRWVETIKHQARLLRLFYRGHREEAMIVKWLRMADIVVEEFENVETEKQFTVSAVHGHFGGSLDGKLMNVPEAPLTQHLAEFKTMSLSQFKQLVKKGMRMHKPEHFAQTQVYMFLEGLERCVYYAVCKNDDEVHIERSRADHKVGRELIEKAERVILSPVPPAPLDEHQSHSECTYCDFKNVCAGFLLPEVNCRTCSAVSVGQNKAWICARHGNMDISPSAEQIAQNKKDGTMDFDRIGCAKHTYIPTIVESHLTLIATDGDTNAYTTQNGEYLENGPKGLTSLQIKDKADRNEL